MKFSVAILILFIASPIVVAKEYFKPKAKLPLEFELILEAYQSNDLSKEESIELADLIKSFDFHFSKYNNSELSLLIKSSIYKSLLRVPYNKNTFLDASNFKTLQENYKKLNTDFSKWITSSLFKDVDLLFSSSAYKDYLIQKSEGELKSPSAKLVSKKIQILNRLFSYFPVESNQLELKLKDTLIEIFKNIHFILVLQSEKSEKVELVDSLSKLQYFEYMPAMPVSTEKTKKSRSVEEILESDQATKQEQGPIGPPLPMPTNDADWLQDF